MLTLSSFSQCCEGHCNTLSWVNYYLMNEKFFVVAKTDNSKIIFLLCYYLKAPFISFVICGFILKGPENTHTHTFKIDLSEKVEQVQSKWTQCFHFSAASPTTFHNEPVSRAAHCICIRSGCAQHSPDTSQTSAARPRGVR